MSFCTVAGCREQARRRKSAHYAGASALLASGTILDSAEEMKIAIPDWQGRVSPVFDVAGHLVVAEVADGQARERRMVRLVSEGLHERVASVAGLGVEVLICGAISRSLELALTDAGVEVIPRTCGEVDQVLAAFAAGKLGDNEFLMPGCQGGIQCRPVRGQHGRGQLPGD
jgi:predicted Fe-Mo cluster-binding NifX family protein